MDIDVHVGNHNALLSLATLLYLANLSYLSPHSFLSTTSPISCHFPLTRHTLLSLATLPTAKSNLPSVIAEKLLHGLYAFML